MSLKYFNLLLIPLLFFLLWGCGTTIAVVNGGTLKGPSASVKKQEQIYSGVKTDFNLAVFTFAYPLLLDIPFSFVFDTLLLPITIPLELSRKKERSKPELETPSEKTPEK